MKINLIKLLLCSMLISLSIISPTKAQIKPNNLVGGIPNPPGPISGPATVVMPTASSIYSISHIASGVTINWTLSPSAAGTISGGAIGQVKVSGNSAPLVIGQLP